MARCIDAWKKYAPERQLKNELCYELKSDYIHRLRGKVMKAFRLNMQYR